MPAQVQSSVLLTGEGIQVIFMHDFVAMSENMSETRRFTWRFISICKKAFRCNVKTSYLTRILQILKNPILKRNNTENDRALSGN